MTYVPAAIAFVLSLAWGSLLTSTVMSLTSGGYADAPRLMTGEPPLT